MTITHMLDEPCIEHAQKNKYGATHIKVNGKRRMVMLHRLAYVKNKGIEIDDISDMVVRHKCDNPRCINPNHLELGTGADNSKDMVDRGRSTKGIRNPMAKLTDSKVQAIRCEHAAGNTTQRAIAKRYGVSNALICLVVNRKIWN